MASRNFKRRREKREKRMEEMDEREERAEIKRLSLDPLSYIFSHISSCRDLAWASGVCKEWGEGVNRSFSLKEELSFGGWRMDDDSIARHVHLAYSLKKLDISRSSLGREITDDGLDKISSAECIGNLMSIYVSGMTGITDRGVAVLVSKARALRHLDIGDTSITDESLFEIAKSCRNLKAIVLLNCRGVTITGLSNLVVRCENLGSINARGTTLTAYDSFILGRLRPASASAFASALSIIR